MVVDPVPTTHQLVVTIIVITSSQGAVAEVLIN